MKFAQTRSVLLEFPFTRNIFWGGEEGEDENLQAQNSFLSAPESAGIWGLNSFPLIHTPPASHLNLN
jgi:hypothetical protein